MGSGKQRCAAQPLPFASLIPRAQGALLLLAQRPKRGMTEREFSRCVAVLWPCSAAVAVLSCCVLSWWRGEHGERGFGRLQLCELELERYVLTKLTTRAQLS